MAFRTEISLRLPFSEVVMVALSTSKKSSRCTQCAIPGLGMYLRALGRPFGFPQSVNRPFLSRDIGKLLITKVNGSGATNKIGATPQVFHSRTLQSSRPSGITPSSTHYIPNCRITLGLQKPRSDFVRGRDVLAQRFAVIKSLERSCPLVAAVSSLFVT